MFFSRQGISVCQVCSSYTLPSSFFFSFCFRILLLLISICSYFSELPSSQVSLPTLSESTLNIILLFNNLLLSCRSSFVTSSLLLFVYHFCLSSLFPFHLPISTLHLSPPSSLSFTCNSVSQEDAVIEAVPRSFSIFLFITGQFYLIYPTNPHYTFEYTCI